jgi:hypothetical protein
VVSERTSGGDDFDWLNRLADCCDLAVQVATELVPLDDITTHTATSHTQTSAVFFEFKIQTRTTWDLGIQIDLGPHSLALSWIVWLSERERVRESHLLVGHVEALELPA